MIPPPTTHDGRNLDPRIADPHGEGALIEVDRPDAAWPAVIETPTDAPAAATYYDLPVVKPPPWRWFVPVYFYASGLGGAAGTLAAAAELAGERRLARRLHGIGAIGEAIGAAFLIADLGRPARFHHMMRVFRPTSPMNAGVWILSASGASSGLALLADLRGRRRRGLGVTGAIGAVAGAMLSTYTAVLLGNTAIPVWEATRRRMPVWFAASSAASLAALVELLGAGASLPRGYTAAAKAAELIGARSVEAAADAVGVARPLREGRSGRMWRGATWLGAGSLLATLARRTRLAGVLGTAAAVLARFAIVEAGRASAADPRATFQPQRRTGRTP